MNSGFALTYFLLLAPFLVSGPQDAQKKDPPPGNVQDAPKKDPPPSKAKEAVIEAFKHPQSTKEEKTITAGSAARKTDSAVKSSGGHVDNAARPGGVIPSGVGGGASSPGGKSDETSTAPAKPAAPPPAPAPAPAVSDVDIQASILFSANALYQQELARRRQIISVEDIDTPEAALAELEVGNDRFVDCRRVRTLMSAQDAELRESLAKKQSPFAVIVTCSDSRAMDNLIFDQELGRLFTIRVAGNTLGELGIASIEYGVEHLGSKVVIIMGHTRCGAVGAVADARGVPLPGNMYIFQDYMSGLLDAIVRDPNETDIEYKGRLELENARRQAQVVYDSSEIVQEFVDHEKILLLPAIYDLHTGKVTFYKAIEPRRHDAEAHEYEGGEHEEEDEVFEEDDVLLQFSL
ncbi:MAG: hypothetical protein LBQ86_05385 [Holophagales bacterium]|jgi:carbonic anhydrase|nr:hypothetical protein [Holophagales bacterium]